MNAYSVLAAYYESLTADGDYERWANYVCARVGRYAPVLRGADFACGTGYFTRALSRAGCDVVGADLSYEMLSEAMARSEGTGIVYLHQDMLRPRGFADLGFVTVINDGVNYIPPKKLVGLFENIRNCLMIGGMIMFDISSPFKLRNVLGNNLFGEDNEDVSYLWFNRLKRDRVEMDLTFFLARGAVYERRDERHVQYIHEPEAVSEALAAAGFEILKKEGECGRRLRENSLRINFIAKRVR